MTDYTAEDVWNYAQAHDAYNERKTATMLRDLHKLLTTAPTREQIARLICYWMPAPPHATCHDNICVGRCMAIPNPETDASDGHLTRGLIDALISAGVQVRK